MMIFKYVGRTKTGSLKRGLIEGASRNEAIHLLREKGISPREITETKRTIFNRDLAIGGNKVKNEHFVIYCRQFATLIRAGISIVEATNILAEQTESKTLAKILVDVSTDIKEGTSFSNAVDKFPKAFPDLFINMVRAGELTGSLDETLDRLAMYFEKQHSLKKKVQSTLAYPIVLLIVTVGVVIFLMLAIIPNFTVMFEQFDSELPAITKIVVAASGYIQTLWWVGLILIGAIVGAFIFAYQSNAKFKYGVHVTILKLPIFGKLLQKAAIARMTRTLASLFESSVPVLQALEIVARVVNNPVISEVVIESKDSLESGGTLSTPLKKHWVFPPLVSQMTAIGEETGSLDFMLDKVADFYEEDVDRTVDTLRSLIEPVMIVLLAVVIGFIVLSIMIPMFSIFTDIQ